MSKEYSESEDLKMETGMDLYCVGMVLTDGDDLNKILTESVDKPGADCYYNNEPYGIVGLYGFGSYRLKEVNLSTEEGQKKWQELKQIMTLELYGAVQAIIVCAEGLILVRDIRSFKAELLKQKSSIPSKLPEDLVIVCDAEDDLDEVQIDEIINY